MTDPQALLEELAGPAGAGLRVERADGSLLWEGACGLAGPDGPAMTAATPFHLASIAKTFTATLVLQLLGEGAFGGAGLDTPFVGLPPFARHLGDRLAPAGTTLRHLLTHTAGLRDTMEDGPAALGGPEGPAPGSLLAHVIGANPGQGWEPWDPARPDDPLAGVINWYLATGTAAAPLSAPGERFRYSDTGYVLLALVAEAAAGKSYPALVRERILDPLGLGEAVYMPWREPRPDGLPSPDAEVWMGPVPVLASGGNLSFDYGGGGLVARPDALIAFLRALLAGQLFATSEPLAAMTAWQAYEGLAAPRRAVGLGLFETGFGDLRFIGHSGAWSGRMLYAPDHRLFLAGSLNRAGAPNDWHARILRAILETTS